MIRSFFDSQKPLSSLFTYDEQSNREAFVVFTRYLHSQGLEMSDTLWHLARHCSKEDPNISFKAFLKIAYYHGSSNYCMP